MARFYWIWAIILVFWVTGNEMACQTDTLRRPRIGLVLSGGGAKGLAHIGVLKVLEEAGIRPDYITGTSMGSIVGGLYAIGYTAGQIESITRRVNWYELLSDEVSRRNISIEEKDEDGKYVMQFHVRNGKIYIPRGLINGHKISSLLSSLTWSVHTIDDFSKLPIPFRCVATDIATVQPVVLTGGFLPDAMRASMAIPSVFTPIEINGNMLVDGGVVRNFPVEDAKEMGADIIIGVDVTSGLYSKSQINSVLEIIDQASTYPIAYSNAKQRAMCNILISPDIQNYNAFSFSDVDTLIKLGEIAARKQWPVLKYLADSLNRIQPVYYKPAHPREFPSILVRHLEIEGLKRVASHIVLSNLDIQEGDSVNERRLRQGIDRVYGTQFFQSVNYKILPDSAGNTLVIRVREQDYNFLKASFNYTNQYKAAILLNATFRNVLGEGSRVLADLRLSENPAVKLHYSIHTPWKPNVGFSQKVAFNIFDAPMFDPEGNKITSFNYRHFLSETEFQSVLSNPLLLGAGLSFNSQYLDANYHTYDSLNIRVTGWQAFGTIVYDNLDRSVFPHLGLRFQMRIEQHFSCRDNNPDISVANKFWSGFFSTDRYIAIYPKFSITGGLATGINEGKNIHPMNFFYLGGENKYETKFFAFPGIPFMSVSSSCFWSGKIGFQAEPWHEKFLFLNGGVVNTAHDLHNLITQFQITYGIEAGAGIKTIIGPISLTFGSNTLTKSLVTNVSIGFVF